MPSCHIDTPTGRLCLTEQDGALTHIRWQAGNTNDDTPLLQEAARQIDAYFAGRLTRFTLPVTVNGSPTQQAICAAIAAVPFGETRPYGDLAKALSLPAQAIGRGCGGNPVPLVIPCHRVLGAQGLGGFSGGVGIETKITLLKHEKAGNLLI